MAQIRAKPKPLASCMPATSSSASGTPRGFSGAASDFLDYLFVEGLHADDSSGGSDGSDGGGGGSDASSGDDDGEKPVKAKGKAKGRKNDIEFF